MRKEHTELLFLIMWMNHNDLSLNKIENTMDINPQKLIKLLEEINEFLLSIGKDSLVIKNGFVHLSEGFNIDDTLESIYDLDFYTYVLSSDERIQIMLTILLMRESKYTMDYFAELFNVSRMTIVRDIKEANERLKSQFNAVISSKRGSGIIFSVDEMLRREIIVMILYEASSLTNYTSYVGYQLNKIVAELNEFNQIENFIHEKYSVLEDNKKLKIYIFVILNRLNRAKYSSNSFSFEIDKEKVYPHSFIKFVIELEKSFDVRLDDLEKKLLFKYIDNSIRKENMDADLYNIVLFFLQKISVDLSADLYKDFILVKDLYNHIHTLSLDHHLIFTFYNLDEFKIKFKSLIKLVDQHIWVIEKYTGYPNRNTLVLSVSIHVAAALSRYLSNTRLLKVALIIDGPLSLLRSFEIELNRIEGITIEAEFNSFEFEKLNVDSNDYDLIISNTNSIHVDIPVVYMDNFTEENLISLKSKIFDIGRKEADFVEKQYHLSNVIKYLSDDTVSIMSENINWEESVQISGRLLLKKNLIKKSYIENAIKNVKEYGPYIILKNEVALAHAGVDRNVKKDSISILINKEGINFEENKKVKILFFTAFNNMDEYVQVLEDIVNFSDDAELVSSVLQVKDNTEFLKIFKKER